MWLLRRNPGPEDEPAPCHRRAARRSLLEYEAENGTTNGTLLGPSRAVNDSERLQQHRRRVVRPRGGEARGDRAVRPLHDDQRRQLGRRQVRHPRLGGRQRARGDARPLRRTARASQSLSLTSQLRLGLRQPADDRRHDEHPERRLRPPLLRRGARAPARPTSPPARPSRSSEDASDTAPYYVIDLDRPRRGRPRARAARRHRSPSRSTARPATARPTTARRSRTPSTTREAKGMNVWIPPGTYLDASTVLNVEERRGLRRGDVAVDASRARRRASSARGAACQFSDLALLGETSRSATTATASPGSAAPSARARRSTNVWIEHFTTGRLDRRQRQHADRRARWSTARGSATSSPTGSTSATARATRRSSSRARATPATTAFASWAYAGAGDPANTGNVFQFDTVQVPWRANCFAIYGGTSNAIEDSVCADVVTYPGSSSTRSSTRTPSAARRPSRATRSSARGGAMYGTQWGALTVSGHDAASPITGVSVQRRGHRGRDVRGPLLHRAERRDRRRRARRT